MIKLSISSVLGFIVLWLAAFCAYAESSGAATQAIQVQLAQVYEPHRAGPVSDYLVSEKYDQIIANRASTMRFIDLRQLYLNGIRSGPGRLRIRAKRSQPQNNKTENG